MSFLRLLPRVGAIVLAAALWIGVATGYRELTPMPTGKGYNARRPRERGPRASGIFAFVRQSGVIVVLAFVGRKVLRIKL